MSGYDLRDTATTPFMLKHKFDKSHVPEPGTVIPSTIFSSVILDFKNCNGILLLFRWLLSRNNLEEREQMGELFEHYVPGAINYIVFGLFGLQQQTPLKTIVPQTPLNLVSIS